MMEPTPPTPGSSGEGARSEPTKKFECPVCRRSFNIWWNLAAHYSVHQRAGEAAPGSPPPGYERDHGKYLTQAVGSRKEKEDRLNGKEFVCVTCDVAFSKQELLAWHMRVNHAGEKVVPVKGSSSGQQGLGSEPASSGAKKERRQKKLKTAAKPPSMYKTEKGACPVCGIWILKRNIPRHVRTVHSVERPYKCRICSRRFNILDNLKSHMTAVHHLTSKAASKPKSRQRSDPPPPPPASPTDLEGRLEKMQIASNIGRGSYSCTICNMTFRQKSVLDSHVMRHTGKTTYSCDQCGMSFATGSELESHQRRAHR